MSESFEKASDFLWLKHILWPDCKINKKSAAISLPLLKLRFSLNEIISLQLNVTVQLKSCTMS